MKITRKLIIVALAMVAATTALIPAQADNSHQSRGKQSMPMSAAMLEQYREAVQKTAQMAGDAESQKLASALGLNILNVTWEDTGRYKGSSVGPNISDMTIQVGLTDPKTKQFNVTCMPVIRYPNFSDKTCDLDPRDFILLVGNESGKSLKRTSLYDLLSSPREFLHDPASWKGWRGSLTAPRDAQVLVSAKACFLPVPKKGVATFNPVLFNYQSMKGDPAVLTILATREGTSMTVIDNTRDAFSTGSVWGQRLFHNANGQRASLTGQRMSDFYNSGGGSSDTPRVEVADTGGLNMVMLIQVPLKQKRPMRYEGGFGGAMAAPGAAYDRKASALSDVEEAVIGHGDLEGPFTEIDGLAIERDPDYPVRVTVQFYKATSNGVVSSQDLKDIKAQIDKVYSMSSYVGSLVTEGDTGRMTEYAGLKIQPPHWWEQFWQRHEKNTGDSREVAMAKLRKLLGQNYMTRPVCELMLNDYIKKGK